MKVIRLYTLAYPIVLPVAFFATWLMGRLSLGYWPRPSLDDPKAIGLAVNFFHTLTTLLLVVGLPLFAGAVLTLGYQAYRDPVRRRNWLLVSGSSVLCLVLAILFLRWDPLGVVAWSAD